MHQLGAQFLEPYICSLRALRQQSTFLRKFSISAKTQLLIAETLSCLNEPLHSLLSKIFLYFYAMGQ